MIENKLSIEKTFRYYTAGAIESPRRLLVALHGYGQLPAYFIRKFSCVPNDFLIVAPEGMHRFYRNGSSGRVGASWMTKEAREDDIRDNLHYLDRLFDELFSNHTFEEVVLLGFSQGGATAARYFYHRRKDIGQLILWGSVFPPDVALPDPAQDNEHTQKLHFVVGDADTYFPDEERKHVVDYFQSIGFKTYLYNGGHDIYCETLLEILG